ncbi:flagellar hook capping FlgD N-terminal domain-containing protein [Phaeovulum sp.]|uniref:flagellar hook capping FlgD N-terminal domain-containing protein n=1 Tax=Phaeovulum sp. TaxID=2934796 RepID=UPI003569A26D
MVYAVNGQSSGSSGSTAQSSDSATVNSDYQTFLMMLTTQMQNQDPLNPIESSDYAVQLATFSGVEQQVKSNQLLESLSAQMGLLGMAQFASWVGMEARTAAPVQFDGATPVTLSPNPPAKADRTILVTLNSIGQEVARTEIAVSSDPINWTGQDSTGDAFMPGQYSFYLESYDASGTMISNDMVEVYSRITEARGGANGTTLVLAGGATVGADEITALRAAPAAN